MKMTKYIFYDTDDSGNADYDICGADYARLIRCLCRYCDVLSVAVTSPDLAWYRALQKLEIPRPDGLEPVITQNGTLKFFRVCPELVSLLLTISDSIFSWIDAWGYHNPTDPTFYRMDGSMFFTSTIHEGYCLICPKAEEDVGDILSDPCWQKIDLPPDIWWPMHTGYPGGVDA